MDSTENVEKKELPPPSNPKIITGPTSYQKEIFDKINKENAIIFMETGKGKTYLSIMVIKSIFNEPYYVNSENADRTKRKVEKTGPKVIFLVNEVSLVLQQSEVINLQTGLIVKAFRGGKTANLNTYDKFRETWTSSEVFVSTPMIIYKFLSIGFLKIDDISLLIFDECHHCNQDHAFNLIMSEFYFYSKLKNKGRLPQILGLTASPLKKKIADGDSLKKVAKESLTELSQNLDSYVIIDPDAVKQNLDEYEMDEKNIQKLNEAEAQKDFLEYKHFKNHDEYDQNINILVEEYFIVVSDFFFDLPKLKEYSDFKDDYKNYVASKFRSGNISDYNTATQKFDYLFKLKNSLCHFGFLEKLTRQIFFIVENINMIAVFKILEDYVNLFKQQSGDNKVELSEENEELKEENLEISNFTKEECQFLIKTTDNFIKKYAKKLKFQADKLSLLKEKIEYVIMSDIKKASQYRQNPQETKPEGHKIIVFVESRVVSDLLNKEINRFIEEKFENELTINDEPYRSISIVGVNSGKRPGKGKSVRIRNSENEMKNKLSQFREGQAQIMVATNTVEEGLDIRSCDHVFVYATMRTVKSFIQMKGRARRKQAVFTIFTENIDQTIKSIQNFVRLILFMRSEFEGDIKKDFRKKGYVEMKKINYPLYPTPSGAKLSIKNVKGLFNEIITEIKKDVKDLECKPYYNETVRIIGSESRNFFTCVLISSSNDIDDDMKEIKSYEFGDKDSALSHTYLIFLEKLHKNEVLNDYFKYTRN